MLPQFPIYIPSKGRSQYCMTMKVLDQMGVPYRVVVEEPEAEAYSKALGDEGKVLVLDMKYKRQYRTLAADGDWQKTGAGAARNYAWDHSIAEGHPWHWVMDDNIRAFYRTCKNRIIRVGDGVIFRAMEDFSQRYENVAMAGPNYEMFIRRRQMYDPIFCNTRIFSCNLIRNDVPFRWHGCYNEDAILSLAMLKAGWCTIQFNAFLQQKMKTQAMSGGNTDELYREGTLAKSQMLVDQHPDVVKLVWKYGRHHHHISYGKLKNNRLIRRNDIEIPKGVNNYGMELKQVRNG